MRRTSLFIALATVVAVLASAFPAGASAGMRAISSVRVSKEGALGRVEVRKDMAAALQRDEGIVALVDVADPRRPKILGRYDDGATQSLDGDLAFSDDGRFVIYARQTVQFSRDGIHVIDVTDPKSPTLRSYSPGGGAYRVLFHSDGSGDYVLLLDAVLGLVVYRFVEGVLIPVHVDALPALKVGGPASAGMEIVGDRLYVTTGETGLQVYDLSDPTAPTILGSWGDEGLAEVEVVASRRKVTVYAATEYWFDPTNENQVVVLNATDPARIKVVDRWSYAPYGNKPPDEAHRLQGLEWRDGVLYAASGEDGVLGFTMCGTIPESSDPPCSPHLEGAVAVDVDSLDARLLVTDRAGRLLVVER